MNRNRLLGLLPSVENGSMSRAGGRTTPRAYDLGQSIVLSYRREALPRSLCTPPEEERARAPLPGSFSAFIRQLGGTFAGSLPATDEIGVAVEDVHDHGGAVQGPEAVEPEEEAVGVEHPTTAEPVVQPATPRAGQAPSAADALREAWSRGDHQRSTHAIAGADAEEVEALEALRAAAGLPPLGQSPDADPAAPDTAAPPRAEAPAAAPEQEPAAQPEQARTESAGASSNPHGVFDQIGSALAYATTFDVGDVRVGRRFSELNAALDRETQRSVGQHANHGREPEEAVADTVSVAEPPVSDGQLLEDLKALRGKLAPSEPTRSVAPEITAADETLEDATLEDATLEDATLEDESPEDESPEDETAKDETPADEAAEDETPEDDAASEQPETVRSGNDRPEESVAGPAAAVAVPPDATEHLAFTGLPEREGIPPKQNPIS